MSAWERKLDTLMTPELAGWLPLAAAVTLGVLGAILVAAGVVALLRARPLRSALRLLAGMLVLSSGALLGTIALGIQGYRALTHEEVAARVSVRPLGPQRIEATFVFPDGREATFDLAGDEIYVDARILKWKPLANTLGLHTAYELDRVAGRFRAIDQERSARRTVYSLGPDRVVDLFGLRRRYAFLAPFLDAEYGSASFVPVSRSAELELRVSTSGLLIREADPVPE
ncbi:MAG TPA: hypothetical protein VLC55_03035 [Burkholderiales bacterium]|nr:hypothetical protein [Burkholderiales bacterium]